MVLYKSSQKDKVHSKEKNINFFQKSVEKVTLMWYH